MMQESLQYTSWKWKPTKWRDLVDATLNECRMENCRLRIEAVGSIRACDCWACVENQTGFGALHYGSMYLLPGWMPNMFCFLFCKLKSRCVTCRSYLTKNNSVREKKKLKEKCRALNSVVRNHPRIPPKDSNAGRGVEKSLLPRNVFSQDDGFGRESVKRFPLEMRQANHAVTGGDLRFLALICTKKWKEEEE